MDALANSHRIATTPSCPSQQPFTNLFLVRHSHFPPPNITHTLSNILLRVIDIDPEPTPAELAAARELIDAELKNNNNGRQPPAPASREPVFSAMMQTELDRIASASPLSPLDISRYEAHDAPSAPDLPPVLAKSAVSQAYLEARLAHLSLLDRHGKNAWLLGNHALEAELAALERDLAAAKRDVDILNIERRRRQEEVRGEMLMLEETWKKGVGRVLETELAVEELKSQIRNELRQRAELEKQQPTEL